MLSSASAISPSCLIIQRGRATCYDSYRRREKRAHDVVPPRTSNARLFRTHVGCDVLNFLTSVLVMMLIMLKELSQSGIVNSVRSVSALSQAFTYDHGGYTSEYLLECDASQKRKWSDQRAFCAAKQNGYAMATFPTRSSVEAFKAILTSNSISPRSTWIAAEDPSQNGGWTWVEGRLANTIFSDQATCRNVAVESLAYPSLSFPASSCSWVPGEPDALGNNQWCLLLWSGGDMLWSDGTCTTPLECTVCERSPCRDGVDFVAANTQTWNSYYPCEPKCKAGAWGSRCEYPLTVSFGIDFSVQYARVCNTSAATSEQARQRCGALLGGGWTLASISQISTVQTLSGYASLASFSERNRYHHTGAAKENGMWKWTDGRSEGQIFSNHRPLPATCYEVTYKNAFLDRVLFKTSTSDCWWASDELAQMNDDCGFFNQQTTASTLLTMGDTGCSSSLLCYACERSLCTVSADCFSGTAASSVSGYYPNCRCTCKAGYYGERCESFSISYTTNMPGVGSTVMFTSQYARMCHTSAVAFYDAADKCTEMGEGWDLASAPTSGVFTTLAGRVSFILSSSVRLAGMWVGGLSDASNKWRFTGGRLRNKVFSEGSTCKTFEYEGATPGMQKSYTQCKWSEAPTLSMCLLIAPQSFGQNARGAELYLRAENCFTQSTNCYVCERSACVIGADCYEGRTAKVSGYFPKCSCRCLRGFRGPSCSLTVTMSLTLTRTVTVSQSLSRTITKTKSGTRNPSATDTRDWSATSTHTTTLSLTGTRTETITNSATGTSTVSSTKTMTDLATASATITVTRSMSISHSGSMPSATRSHSHNVSSSASVTLTLTLVPSLTESRPVTMTTTGTETSSSSQTESESAPSLSPTHSLNESLTETLSRNTISPTRTLLSTNTLSLSFSGPTKSLTASSSDTETLSASLSASFSPSSNLTSSSTLAASESQSDLPSQTPNSSYTPSHSKTISATETSTRKLYPPIPVEPIVNQIIGAVLVSGAVISPVTGGSTSVALALIRAARCGAEEDPEVEETPLSVLVHPLRFSLPGGGRVAQEQAAVIGNAIIIPLAVLGVIGGPVAWAVRVVSKEPSHAKVFEVIGWPSVVVLPYTVLMEGLGSCLMELYYDASSVSVFIAVVGLGSAGGVLLVWAWALFYVIPRRLMHVEETPLPRPSPSQAKRRGNVLDEIDDGNTRPQTVLSMRKGLGLSASVAYWLAWLMHARKEWSLLDVAVDTEFKRRSEQTGKKSAAGGSPARSVGPINNSITNRSFEPTLSVALLESFASDMSAAGASSAEGNVVGGGSVGGDVHHKSSQIEDDTDDEDAYYCPPIPIAKRDSKPEDNGERAPTGGLQQPAAVADKMITINRYKAHVESMLLRFTNMISEKSIMSADLLCLIFSFGVGLLEGMDTGDGQSRIMCKVQVAMMSLFALLQAVLGLLAFIPLELSFNVVQFVVTLAVIGITIWAVVANEDGFALPEETESILEALNTAINFIGLLGLFVGVVRTYSQLRRCRARRVRRQQYEAEAEKKTTTATAATNHPVLDIRQAFTYEMFPPSDSDDDRRSTASSTNTIPMRAFASMSNATHQRSTDGYEMDRVLSMRTRRGRAEVKTMRQTRRAREALGLLSTSEQCEECGEDDYYTKPPRGVGGVTSMRNNSKPRVAATTQMSSSQWKESAEDTSRRQEGERVNLADGDGERADLLLYEAFSFDDFSLPGRALTRDETQIIQEVLGDFDEYEYEKSDDKLGIPSATTTAPAERGEEGSNWFGGEIPKITLLRSAEDRYSWSPETSRSPSRGPQTEKCKRPSRRQVLLNGGNTKKAITKEKEIDEELAGMLYYKGSARAKTKTSHSSKRDASQNSNILRTASVLSANASDDPFLRFAGSNHTYHSGSNTTSICGTSTLPNQDQQRPSFSSNSNGGGAASRSLPRSACPSPFSFHAYPPEPTALPSPPPLLHTPSAHSGAGAIVHSLSSSNGWGAYAVDDGASSGARTHPASRVESLVGTPLREDISGVRLQPSTSASQRSSPNRSGRQVISHALSCRREVALDTSILRLPQLAPDSASDNEEG